MKKNVLLMSALIVLSIGFTFSQTVTLLGSLNPYPGQKYADIWGYSAGGREYAIMGATGGTTFIDVTDPFNPVEIIKIPGPNSFYEWRDIKIHSHYAYITTEGSGSGAGMQIVDLSQLPVTATLVNTYTTTFTTAHNLYIDNGYAYIVGANPGSGVHILNLANPVNPVEVGYYSSSGYVHDIYVWNDTGYVSSEGEYATVNLTFKNNPVLINSSMNLPGIYAHSGWLTEDKRYFIACEEFNVRDLTVWDLSDRSNWELKVPQWQSSSSSPIHNVFVLGNYAHIAYYEDGYVVLDISNPENPQLAGQYDTDPTPSTGSYKGAWGCYPYLPSGNVLVSDMQTGLYIFDFDDGTPVELTSFTAVANKNSVILNWTTATETNNFGFEVERKSEKEFVTIGFINGAGNSTEPQKYSYTDNDLEAGRYEYRLKQIDFDGNYDYSNVVEAEINILNSLTLEQNYPNPFNPSTRIKYSIPESGFVNISIYNLLGEKVNELVNQELASGDHYTDFNAGNLPTGIYIAKLKSGNAFQFIKMSLIK
jgi:choice-of-anchor B domain-containing protein